MSSSGTGRFLMEVYILHGGTMSFDGTFADPPWSDDSIVIGVFKDYEKCVKYGEKRLEDDKKKSSYDSTRIYRYWIDHTTLIE